MPTDPNHEYVDKPHTKTVHLASQGWRYGCHSSMTNDSRPRGRATDHIAHPWSKAGGVRVTTRWLDKPCGHTTRATDAACEGCANQHQPPA